MVALLTSCSTENASFMDPQGPIAASQKTHLLKISAIMLIPVIPVFLLVPFFLWRYRYRNKKAHYTPDWEFSGILDILMWGIPFVIVIVLSTQLWQNTKELDPYKPIASTQAPLKIQVVGLDWKWLFIYPELGIATVGEMAFPADRPVALDMTSDTVMQSFMIGSLAGQVYVMPAMQTQLQLKADKPGIFEGENTQYNGTGFPQQKFNAVAMTDQKFATWAAKVKSQGMILDEKTYRILGERSTAAEAGGALGARATPPGIIHFRLAVPDMFHKIMMKYQSGKPIDSAQQTGGASYSATPLPNDTKDASQ